QDVTVAVDQLRRGVEADVVDDAGDERVAGEARIEPGVRYDDLVGLDDADRAHRVLPAADTGFEADRGDLVLFVRGDDVDHGVGHAAHVRGEFHDGRQVGQGRRVDHPEV